MKAVAAMQTIILPYELNKWHPKNDWLVQFWSLETLIRLQALFLCKVGADVNI